MSARFGRSFLAAVLAAALITCTGSGVHQPELPDDAGATATDATPEGMLPSNASAPPEPSADPGADRSDAADAAEGRTDFDDLPLDAVGFFERPLRPEPAIVSETIGPEGGALRLGDFEIEVPEGAVTRNTLFMIRRPADRRSRTRVVAELRPHHVTFERPVVVRMPLRGTSLEGATDATIVRFDGGEWTARSTRIVDDGTRLETRTRHLSFWGTSLFLLGELSSGG